MTPPATTVQQCAALGDPTRWEILARVGDRALTASELAELLPVSRQAISKHLAVLLEVGLVQREPTGRMVRFAAVGSQLSAMGRDLERLGRGWERRLDRLARMAEARTQAEAVLNK